MHDGTIHYCLAVAEPGHLGVSKMENFLVDYLYIHWKLL
jgi:hypothetical protein